MFPRIAAPATLLRLPTVWRVPTVLTACRAASNAAANKPAATASTITTNTKGGNAAATKTAPTQRPTGPAKPSLPAAQLTPRRQPASNVVNASNASRASNSAGGGLRVEPYRGPQRIGNTPAVRRPDAGAAARSSNFVVPPLERLLLELDAREEVKEVARLERIAARPPPMWHKRIGVKDEEGRFYARGGRKDASAKVWLQPGTGTVTINERPLVEYFSRLSCRDAVIAPFMTTGTLGKYDVTVKVSSGGTTGQSEAIRHGISQALSYVDPTWRVPLRKAGFIIRDPRVVERKKPGKAKARRSYQWSKR